MYKQPTIPSGRACLRSASRCAPKRIAWGFLGSRSYVHLFETKLETPSLLLVLLSRGGSMAALKLSRLRAFSR
eukprot:scaffold16236_cov36-Phaeocystis_antarctica.AAC.1